jgi:preprotein translocase SecE subunit
MPYSRYINLSFAVAGLITWVILLKFTGGLFESFKVTDTVLFSGIKISQMISAVSAFVGTVYVYRRADVQTWAGEVAVEVSKVTWPSWGETKQHTMVVIVFSLIVSAIIGGFDLFWKWVTDMILA